MLQLVLADHKTIHRLCEGLGEEELRVCSLSGVDVRSGEGKGLSSDIWSGITYSNSTNVRKVRFQAMFR